MAADVGVAGIRKTYGDVVAVDDVDLTVADGEFFTLLGPSGSGKTTTLRIIAGFEQPDAGRVTLGGEDITRRPPYARDVNTVFQDYALFPHMTVERERRLRPEGEGRRARRARRARCARCCEMVRLDGYGARKPVQLSGGQRQRVALARSIVNRPKVLLLDEPLGALDLKLRQEMQVFLKALQQDLGMTFLYVTHDQEEALTMSDHVAVFNEGRIEQVGSPQEIYERPATEFVAGFVGTSNILERNGRRFSVRPERIELNGHGEPGVIADVVFVGSFTRYLVDTDARRAADRRAPERRLARSSRARRSTSRWRDEDAYEIKTTPEHPSSRRSDDEAHVGARRDAGRRTGASRVRRRPSSSGGTLNMIAWEGYTQPQWVKPFEKATGCTVHAKYAGSSDEMVTLMRSGGGGQYDMVSASGDASLRLIYGKDVQPIDVSKIPDFKNFGAAFKSPPNNTIDGKHYGVSLQWGPNTLLYNTKKVKPAPTSWAAIYSPKYKGKVTVPDNPIQIADAALYLMKTQPSLGIKDPYELNSDPVLRDDQPAQEAEAADQEVLGARLGRDRPVQERRRRDRRLVAVPDEHADRREGAGEGPRPEGRGDGLARHVDGLVEDEEPRLRLQVAGVDLDAEGAGPAGDLLR